MHVYVYFVAVVEHLENSTSVQTWHTLEIGSALWIKIFSTRSPDSRGSTVIHVYLQSVYASIIYTCIVTLSFSATMIV